MASYEITITAKVEANDVAGATKVKTAVQNFLTPAKIKLALLSTGINATVSGLTVSEPKLAK